MFPAFFSPATIYNFESGLNLSYFYYNQPKGHSNQGINVTVKEQRKVFQKTIRTSNIECNFTIIINQV
jgi:hypothetical protein